MKTVTGRVWKFAANIDTDVLAPAQSMGLDWEKRKSLIIPTRPGFTDEFAQGDIIVADRNWGCGSSREQAVENMLRLGVAGIFAESFARIFFRNSVANALPAITCPGIYAAFDEGDELSFDWETSTIQNLSKGTSLQARPYSKDMMSIVQQGGLVPMMKARFSGA